MMKNQLTTNPEKRPIAELEETEVPRILDTTMNEETLEEDQEMENLRNLNIHPKRRIFTGGNQHGYKRLSKV